MKIVLTHHAKNRMDSRDIKLEEIDIVLKSYYRKESVDFDRIMEIEYDKQADALYVAIQKGKKILKSKEIENGVIVDFDKGNKVVGIEVLDLSKRYNNKNVLDFINVKNFRNQKTAEFVGV